MTSAVEALAPEAVVERFQADGFVTVPAVLPRAEAEQLREIVEGLFQDPETHADPEQDHVRGRISLMRVFERHRAFQEILAREPVVGLVERILGADCHVVAQNALRTPPNSGIVKWHIDDQLLFPFLAELPAIPDAVPLPCFTLNVLVALSDIDDERFGPTQVVVGSHRTGAEPEHRLTLPAGAQATSLLVRAGDAYIVNSQTWHRGAPNCSDRVRYVLTTTYGRRFVAQRFYPFLNYRMPEQVLVDASPRLLRLLGRHDKGPYG